MDVRESTQSAAGGRETIGTAWETREAFDEAVRSHMPLVGHIVRDVLSRVPGHVSRDDLTSAGLTALVVAARGYDPSRGVAFATYATTRVRGAILDELRAVDWASRSVRRRAREVEATRGTLAAQLGRAATDAEVASASGLSLEDVTRNAEDVNRASVLSLHGFGETPLDEIVTSRAPSPEDEVEQGELTRYLVDAVAELPERLRVVVQGYFFGERPMADLAAELGVSESRISQMRAEALVLLKDVLHHAFSPEQVERQARPDGVVARRRDAYFAAVDARAAASVSSARRAAADREGRVAS